MQRLEYGIGKQAISQGGRPRNLGLQDPPPTLAFWYAFRVSES